MIREVWAWAYCFAAGTLPALARGGWREEAVLRRLILGLFLVLYVLAIVVSIKEG